MRNGIVAGPLLGGLKYGAEIERAAIATSFSPQLLYAVGWTETIKLDVVGVWDATTVISPDGGHGVFQLTPAASGNPLPANWQDVFTNASAAVTQNGFLRDAENFWAARQMQGAALVRCIAANFNAGPTRAMRGHDAGDVGMFTTFDRDAQGNKIPGTSYSDRVLAAYQALAANRHP